MQYWQIAVVPTMFTTPVVPKSCIVNDILKRPINRSGGVMVEFGAQLLETLKGNLMPVEPSPVAEL